MKSVLLSIRPKWCEKICHEIGKEEAGKPIYEKRIEVRKTAPKEVPFKVYIYCTKPSVRGRYSVGSMVFNTDELYRTPDGKIKYGDSIELIGYGSENYSKDNFLNGKVIGEFICDKVYEWECKNRLELVGELGLPNWRASYMIFTNDLEKTCLTYDDLWNYGQGKALYGWHISDLKIYDKPKELSEFCIPCKVSCKNCKNPLYFECACEEKGKKIVTRPPQSWCYVEGKNGK